MLGASGALTLVTVAGLAAGLGREWLLVHNWGAGARTDAFLVALFLPEAIRMMLGGGLLSDTLKDDVAQVIEHHPAKSPCGIGQDEQHRESNDAFPRHAHRVDCPLQEVGQGELRGGRRKDQCDSADDPPPQPPVVLGP